MMNQNSAETCVLKKPFEKKFKYEKKIVIGSGIGSLILLYLLYEMIRR